MARLIILLILAMFVYFTVKNIFRAPSRKMSGKKPEDAGTHDLQDAGEMAQDPVCGTYVSMDNSPSVYKNGRKFYFCSEECKKKLMENENN